MIFPARNHHLWLGFSMAMLNNQMVITTFPFFVLSCPKNNTWKRQNCWEHLCTTGEFVSLPNSGLDSFELYLGAQFQKLRRGNPLDLRIFLLTINFWIFQSWSMSVFIDLGFASPTGCPFLKRKGCHCSLLAPPCFCWWIPVLKLPKHGNV